MCVFPYRFAVVISSREIQKTVFFAKNRASSLWFLGSAELSSRDAGFLPVAFCSCFIKGKLCDNVCVCVSVNTCVWQWKFDLAVMLELMPRLCECKPTLGHVAVNGLWMPRVALTLTSSKSKSVKECWECVALASSTCFGESPLCYLLVAC